MIEPDNIYNMGCLEGLRQMEDATVDCCVTSPPYFALRDYGCEGQIGLEQSPEEYIARLCDVFREVLRVMKPEATCWVVIGELKRIMGFPTDYVLCEALCRKIMDKAHRL